MVPSSYLPHTDSDRKAMLRAIGIDSVEELFRDVPEKFRAPDFKLPPPLFEMELKDELRRMSGLNASFDEHACFLGAGYYRHFIPGVVGHITGRSEFYTAYTPYQPERSQGTLQAIYEYQSMVCALTGMEVSNAGMYDGSTAVAEAALMACRITDRKRVTLLATVNSNYTEVVSTYVTARDYEWVMMDTDNPDLTSESACLIVQQPNFFGCFEDLTIHAQRAHQAGALLIVITDPISLGMFRPPAGYGADIVVAEGQALGSPICLGGPGLGIFTCRGKYLRQIPGRIVGKTVDTEGKPGYVLTLATREQHIRRERATSNICTNEALVALAATVYLATLGKTGLRRVAELCYHKAHYAASRIAGLAGYSLVFPEPFFKEFVVRCPLAPSKINEILFQSGIIGGLDVSRLLENSMLLCVTEMNTRRDIDRLVEILGQLSRFKE
jgi:glycine dehydrogenase subunit 1